MNMHAHTHTHGTSAPTIECPTTITDDGWDDDDLYSPSMVWMHLFTNSEKHRCFPCLHGLNKN